nr:MAG TPA: hypothetical protein [Caudoviricetes sp.]
MLCASSFDFNTFEVHCVQHSPGEFYEPDVTFNLLAVSGAYVPKVVKCSI